MNQKKVNEVSAAMAALFAKKKPRKTNKNNKVKKLKQPKKAKANTSVSPPKAKPKAKTIAQMKRNLRLLMKNIK